MPASFIVALVMACALWLPAPAAAESNPLVDLLKQKGVVSEEEAGKLERQLDDYYQKKLAPAPAPIPAVVKPAAAEAPAPAKEATPVVTVEERLKKLEEVGKKSKVRWGGEARFRIMNEHGDAPISGDGTHGTGTWAGLRASTGAPSAFGTAGLLSFSKAVNTGPDGATAVGRKDVDTSYPVRLRLNWEADVVPDWVNVYGRFTMNKRWGTFSSFPEQDPFNAPNSFAGSIGSDIIPRSEEIFMTMKIPYIPWDVMWYVGRLPGMDGAPSRQDRSIFPRLFIDSEIDGTLLKVALPETPLSDYNLPCAPCPIAGLNGAKFRGGPLGAYEKKLGEKNGLYLGYLVYNETKLTGPGGKDSVVSDFVPIVGRGPDSDVWLAQIQMKLSKETQLIVNGLWMPDWFMPRSDFNKEGAPTQSISPVFNPVGGTIPPGGNAPGSWTNGLDIPFFTSDYQLYGGYLDTQLLGFQLYGSFYVDRLDVPPFTYAFLVPDGKGGAAHANPVNYEGHTFWGRIWHVGMNTGSWLAKWNSQLCVEYANGSDSWINPFNYRGFRRKGTVLFPEKNSFFGGNQVVGFYPFATSVWDAYADYYWSKARFRLGVMWFDHKRHSLVNWTGDSTTGFTPGGGPDRIFGWSRYETHWWPYFEVNLSF